MYLWMLETGENIMAKPWQLDNDVHKAIKLLSALTGNGAIELANDILRKELKARLKELNQKYPQPIKD